MQKFIDRVFSNEEIISLLLKLKKSEWKKINNFERIDLLKKIVSELNKIYPEFGECKIDFISIDNDMYGDNVDNYVRVNINSSDNQFCNISTIMHELRHFYQNKAIELYFENGVIHELFEDSDFKEIVLNNENSQLSRASNYLCSNDNNYIEYNIQPCEYDAESFSKKFMAYLATNYLDSNDDVSLCMNANSEFDDMQKMLKENSRNLINFSKRYKLNYEDYVKDNRAIFISDEVKAKKYIKLLENIDVINKEEVIVLCSPCFWDKYDFEIKISLLNRYLELNDLSLDIKAGNNEIIINNKKVKSNNVFEIMDLLFNEMANKEIERILAKNNQRKLMRVEREIRLNFKNEFNQIKKEENPLFYEVQPYMLYKNNYVLRNFYDFFRCLDVLYDSRDNFYDLYSKYIKKYDVECLMKKVKILTGVEFEDFYDKMLSKMSNRKNKMNR